ncbi:Gfo/Idh/MocA family oxidoreductase [Pseudoflavitalea sp. X16]|uniref:Gfo/Idh/MocA family protein n=1 Tax=Paraflavitalea devenefica TaxID=2716334 RepID=UPI00141EF4BF|nr:Gfo/Idh/MocA family oxidoreductase [Paraflavitalea devenefica]NII25989.1 Gfo/Idh/MocA family oxidoreductase [Paraflavitalea devenefica]
MGKVIRWGILGSGHIAKKFAADLMLVKDARLVAVGSRSMVKATAFADAFPVDHQHDSYEALAADPEVDVIYIATPHSLHYENVLLCLQHGKAVLCEKPFALNSRQTRAMIELAREKKVFLMEALWSAFLPQYIKVQELLRAGKLGTVKSVLASFGFRPGTSPNARLYDPALGGGSLLDIGIYNVFMAMSVLGRPDVIEASMTPAATGVDEQCAVLFKYKDGAMAQLFSTFATDLATEADICGTAGRLKLTTRFFDTAARIEFYPGRLDTLEVIEVPKEEGFGYQYEARHVNECLQKGLTESPVRSLDDTLALMEVLDAIRQAAGIKYAADE